MTIETTAEHGEPDPGRADPALLTPADAAQAAPAAGQEPELQAHAASTITRVVNEHSVMAKELKAALRTRVYAQELGRRAAAAEAKAEQAEQQESNLAVKADPGDRWIFPFTLGAVLVVALTVLDAFPLNWAAQAFGLDSGATMVVTVILLIAAIAAMVGFEVTRDHARPRGILIAIVTAGFLALLGLRAEYLITVSGDSFPVAVFQSTLLTAISAGLVVCGSVVLARTRSFTYSRACAVARRAARAASEARAAYDQAVDKLHRHIGTIHQMILPEALRYAAPEGVGHASWAAALEQALRALFPLT
jgi:hypothetical protein